MGMVEGVLNRDLRFGQRLEAKAKFDPLRLVKQSIDVSLVNLIDQQQLLQIAKVKRAKHAFYDPEHAIALSSQGDTFDARRKNIKEIASTLVEAALQNKTQESINLASAFGKAVARQIIESGTEITVEDLQEFAGVGKAIDTVGKERSTPILARMSVALVEGLVPDENQVSDVQGLSQAVKTRLPQFKDEAWNEYFSTIVDIGSAETLYKRENSNHIYYRGEVKRKGRSFFRRKEKSGVDEVIDETWAQQAFNALVNTDPEKQELHVKLLLQQLSDSKKQKVILDFITSSKMIVIGADHHSGALEQSRHWNTIEQLLMVDLKENKLTKKAGSALVDVLDGRLNDDKAPSNTYVRNRLRTIVNVVHQKSLENLSPVELSAALREVRTKYEENTDPGLPVDQDNTELVRLLYVTKNCMDNRIISDQQKASLAAEVLRFLFPGIRRLKFRKPRRFFYKNTRN